jgi:hypothetical protein
MKAFWTAERNAELAVRTGLINEDDVKSEMSDKDFWARVNSLCGETNG